MRLTLLDAEDQALYCQSPARADFSEIFAVAMLSTFSTVSAKLGVALTKVAKENPPPGLMTTPGPDYSVGPRRKQFSSLD
jgi:hypothetical protein